jgi:hypothetical protein
MKVINGNQVGILVFLFWAFQFWLSKAAQYKLISKLSFLFFQVCYILNKGDNIKSRGQINKSRGPNVLKTRVLTNVIFVYCNIYSLCLKSWYKLALKEYWLIKNIWLMRNKTYTFYRKFKNGSLAILGALEIKC